MSTQDNSNHGQRGGGHPMGYKEEGNKDSFDVKHVKEEDELGGDAGDFQYAVSLQEELARPTRRKQSAVVYHDHVDSFDDGDGDYEEQDKTTRVKLKVNSVPSTSRTSRATEYADSQINLPYDLMLELDSNINKKNDVSPEIFDAAVLEIYKLMEKDNFIRFKMSQEFQNYFEKLGIL